MRTFILPLVLCWGLRAQTSGVEGVIIDTVTRQPIPGVHMMVMGLADLGGIPREAYGAVSGPDGHFSIGNMKPATYMLAPQKTGYVQVPGQTGNAWSTVSFVLKPGEPVQQLVVEMTPKAFISGRVTDENGDPLQRVQVEATPAEAGTPQSFARRMFGQTDERGQFRIGGAPGKYLLQAATMGRQIQNVPLEIRSDGTETPAYGTTWYPGTANKASAGTIETLPGREVTGLDIRLIRQRSFSVHGTVSGFPAGERAFVSLLSGDERQQQSGGMRSSPADPDGQFAFAGLVQGSYSVWARLETPSVHMRSQFETVRLDGGDATSPNLRLVMGEELAASVEGLGEMKDKATILLQPVSPVERIYVAGVKGNAEADGIYRIKPVFLGKYRVKVAPLPENSYVKSVRLDASEARDLVVDLTRGVGGARMKVTISGNAGVVEGTVVDPDGKPSQIPFTMVTLAASVDEVGQENVKRVSAGAGYTFRNIRPGKYRLYAVDPMTAAGAGINPLQAGFEKAEQIEIKEGDRIKRDVVVGGKEAARAR